MQKVVWAYTAGRLTERPIASAEARWRGGRGNCRSAIRELLLAPGALIRG